MSTAVGYRSHVDSSSYVALLDPKTVSTPPDSEHVVVPGHLADVFLRLRPSGPARRLFQGLGREGAAGAKGR